MTAAINAIVPYFGAKRKLADRIVAEMGEHRAYWGLCCGSLAIELAKPRCMMETIVDLHGDLTNLILVLADPDDAQSLYERVYKTVMSDELHRRALAFIRGNPAPTGDAPADVKRAHAYFVTSWMGRNGMSGTTTEGAGFAVRYTSNGGHPGTRWQSAIASIPWWHERLLGMTVVRDDLFKRIPRIEDKAGTVICVDSPYLIKSTEYVHDFAQEVPVEAAMNGLGVASGKRNDHVRMALELRRFQATRVLVCYYDHPSLDVLYPDWTKIYLECTKSLPNQAKRDQQGIAESAPEVLLINGPSLTEDS